MTKTPRSGKTERVVNCRDIIHDDV